MCNKTTEEDVHEEVQEVEMHRGTKPTSFTMRNAHVRATRRDHARPCAARRLDEKLINRLQRALKFFSIFLKDGGTIFTINHHFWKLSLALHTPCTISHKLQFYSKCSWKLELDMGKIFVVCIFICIPILLFPHFSRNQWFCCFDIYIWFVQTSCKKDFSFLEIFTNFPKDGFYFILFLFLGV